MSLTIRTPFDEQDILVKNTFIQLPSTPPGRPMLRRSRTDSELCCIVASDQPWFDSDGVDSEASTATVAPADDSSTGTESDDDGHNSATLCNEALTICTPFKEQQLFVKNTFIDEPPSTLPRRPRSMTDPAFCVLSLEELRIDSDSVDSEASTVTVAQADDVITITESADDEQYSDIASNEALTKLNVGDQYLDTHSEPLWVPACFVSPMPCLQQGFVAQQCASFDDAVYAHCTTVMLRNLPIEFTPAMLLELFNLAGLYGMYDFVYMPVDFKSEWWLGYAFINCVSHEAALCFRNCLEGFCDWPFPCKKVCRFDWGDLKKQGREANVKHFRNNSIMHHSVPVAWKPLLFENGELVEFPPPTRRIRAPRRG